MKKQIIPIAVVAVILLAGLALWFGLRGGTTPLPENEVAPGVTIFAPEDTRIFVSKNNEPEGEGGEADPELQGFVVPSSGRYNLDLESGNYTLLVNRGDAYYPWSKTIDVSAGTATEFYPILFPRETEREIVDPSDPVYEQVTQAFSVPATLPTIESPKQNVSGTAEVYVEGNTIFITWLGESADMPEFLCPGENTDECLEQPIFEFDAGTVENIEFYGENEGVLILDRVLQSGQKIMALEVDRRGGISSRNQHPLYTGTAPAFRIIEGEIYVSDGGVISRLVLE